MLLAHGTKAFSLKPHSILHTADEDLKRWARNYQRYHDGDQAGPVERYAFHRFHVRKAAKKDHATGRDVIACALANLAIGLESAKYHTRVLYRDEALLKAALHVDTRV